MVLYSDRIGRKTAIVFWPDVYIWLRVCCVCLPHNEWSLIAARVLQALGGCVGVVIARAAIRDRLDMHSVSSGFCQHDDCDRHCTHHRAESGCTGY